MFTNQLMTVKLRNNDDKPHRIGNIAIQPGGIGECKLAFISKPVADRFEGILEPLELLHDGDVIWSAGPVEEAPVEEAPVEEAPVEEAPVEEVKDYQKMNAAALREECKLRGLSAEGTKREMIERLTQEQ